MSNYPPCVTDFDISGPEPELQDGLASLVLRVTAQVSNVADEDEANKLASAMARSLFDKHKSLSLEEIEPDDECPNQVEWDR